MCARGAGDDEADRIVWAHAQRGAAAGGGAAGAGRLGDVDAAAGCGGAVGGRRRGARGLGADSGGRGAGRGVPAALPVEPIQECGVHGHRRLRRVRAEPGRRRSPGDPRAQREVPGGGLHGGGGRARPHQDEPDQPRAPRRARLLAERRAGGGRRGRLLERRLGERGRDRLPGPGWSVPKHMQFPQPQRIPLDRHEHRRDEARQPPGRQPQRASGVVPQRQGLFLCRPRARQCR